MNLDPKRQILTLKHAKISLKLKLQQFWGKTQMLELLLKKLYGKVRASIIGLKKNLLTKNQVGKGQWAHVRWEGASGQGLNGGILKAPPANPRTYINVTEMNNNLRN